MHTAVVEGHVGAFGYLLAGLDDLPGRVLATWFGRSDRSENLILPAQARQSLAKPGFPTRPQGVTGRERFHSPVSRLLKTLKPELKTFGVAVDAPIPHPECGEATTPFPRGCWYVDNALSVERYRSVVGAAVPVSENGTDPTE